MCMLIISYFR
uniref:Uncharacterized protein n=1 Tax=Anguilla anguilla TaxID=7936 RepID=A0A0E9QHH9_ANGAN